MRTSTKVAIGVSVISVAAIATGAVISGKLIDKVSYAKKRRKVKGFVEDNLGGNAKILDIVDNLSDGDLDHLFKVVDKVKDSKKQISVYGNNLKDTTSEVKNRLMDFVGDLME